MTEYKKQNIILNSIFCLFIICEILNFFLLPYETVFNSMGERKNCNFIQIIASTRYASLAHFECFVYKYFMVSGYASVFVFYRCDAYRNDGR